MFRKIRIKKREYGFLYTDGDYVGLLKPGVHRLGGWFKNHQVSIHDTHQAELREADLLTVLEDPQVGSRVSVVDIADHQRGLVWIDGRFHGFLGPSKTAFWNEPHKVRVEILDTQELEFEHASLGVMLAHSEASTYLQEVLVNKGFKALLFINESFLKILEPGRYAFWKNLAHVRVQSLEMREQQVDVAGQEILTKDNVSLRVNLVGTWQILDPVAACEQVASAQAAVYRELQLTLRGHIGGYSLEDLLAQKTAISTAILQEVAPRVQTFGVKLTSVGLKDVILPGEMKVILNQVIEAEKQAKANLITRREETAATRSLLNTARLMESNPTLLRMKELETAERIAQRVQSIHISQGIDELIERLVPSKKAPR